MMTSDRLPMAWIWRTTRPKRRSAAGTCTQQVGEEEAGTAERAHDPASVRAPSAAGQSAAIMPARLLDAEVFGQRRAPGSGT